MTDKGSRSDRQREGGYTLLEMLVMVILIALTAIVTLPNLTGMTARHRVNDAANQVESAIQYARMKAIAERTNYIVQFMDNQFNIVSDTNGNGSWDFGERPAFGAPTHLPVAVGFGYPANGDTTAAAQSAAASGCKCLVFQPNGCLQNTLDGINLRSLAIGDGKEFRQVHVSECGSVTMQKWDTDRQEWK